MSLAYPPPSDASQAVAISETKSPVRTKPRRKITLQDVEAMAKLVAKRLTETEACNLLEINNQSWRDWKQKHKNETTFEYALTRMKAGKIASCMDGIERAGPKDWRAYDRLLQITDARFRDNGSGNPLPQATGLIDSLLVEALRRAFPEAPKALEDKHLEPAKALADKPAGIEPLGIEPTPPTSQLPPAIDIEATPVPPSNKQ